MKNIINLFGAIFTGIYTHIVLPLFKQCRAVSRTDTPDQERTTFNTLMAWSMVVLILLVILILMGWDYVFTIL